MAESPTDAAKLARVRAFKEQKLAEEKQRLDKYRDETIDRIISAVYPQEPKLTFFEKDELWNRVNEYLALRVSTALWGDAYHRKTGKDIREAYNFRLEVEAALNNVPAADARYRIAKMLDQAEKIVRASLQ
jgi:hypothetical protein